MRPQTEQLVLLNQNYSDEVKELNARINKTNPELLKEMVKTIAIKLNEYQHIINNIIEICSNSNNDDVMIDKEENTQTR